MWKWKIAIRTALCFTTVNPEVPSEWRTARRQYAVFDSVVRSSDQNVYFSANSTCRLSVAVLVIAAAPGKSTGI